MFKIICILMLTAATAQAQDSTVNWINKNAYPLRSDSTLNDQKDLNFLSYVLKDKSIVGLGDASHGISEFYFQQRRIMEYLIQNANYKTIALEAPSDYIKPLNTFITEGVGVPKDQLKSMGLYNSKEFYDLILWLVNYNKTKDDDHKVKLIGIDDESYWGDPFTRDEQMANNFIENFKVNKSKTIILAHNLHIAKDTTMSGYKATGYYLKQEFGDSFYSIGSDTYEGFENVLNNGELEKHRFEGTEGTFSSLFSKTKYQQFFIDFTSKNNPLMNQVNRITNLTSNWKTPTPLPVRLGSDFDGLIFIREASATVGLK